jgi:hypothetical protein
MILILISMIIVFMAGYPFDNMDTYGPAKILNSGHVVYPGETLEYRFTYKKILNIPGELTKELILLDNPEYSIKYKTFLGNIPAGTHTVTASIKIPDTDFVVGRAKLVFNLKYSIFGGMRTIYDSYESEPFVIRKRKKG